MDSAGQKAFKDSVHGYIHVPKEWCNRFIDTPIFQRLRHIEQTSMRCLYPSARHDRFIHSLGVYHLGKMAFENLCNNAKTLMDQANIRDKKNIERLKNSFLIACLLHDCAHAPFSHTFEDFYDIDQRLNKPLLEAMESDPDFQADFQNASPKSHEKASAIVLLQRFSNEVKESGGDPLLAARMIIGCLYRATTDQKKRFYNVLIQLLNSHSIDVDKLDYITRDTWASGVSNTAVDIDRLLTAVTAASYADGTKIGLAFRKTALSVVQGVVDARNFLFTWIYGHHKVEYDKHLLRKAVSMLACALNDNYALDKIFSLDALTAIVEVGNEKIFGPSDGDIIFLLKRYQKDIPEAVEWLSRQHTRPALWKTYAEYEQLFKSLNADERGSIEKRLSDGKQLIDWWLEQGGSAELLPVVRAVKIKPYQISRNDIRIVLSENKDPVSYDTLFERISGSAHKEDPNFFYFFRPKDFTAKTDDELRRAILDLA